MKRIIIGATLVAMFIGTSAIAEKKVSSANNVNGKTTNTAVANNQQTENVLQSGKKGKMHKKHAKRMHHKKRNQSAPKPEKK